MLGHKRTHVIKVLLSDAELAAAKMYAKREPLSSYARRLMTENRIELKMETTQRASITAPELAESIAEAERKTPDVRGERPREAKRSGAERPRARHFSDTWMVWLALTLGLMLAGQAQAQEIKTQTFSQSTGFWARFALQLGATSADYISSQGAQARGAHEENPLFGSHPSYPRMFAIGTPIEFGYAYAGWRMSRSHHEFVRKLSWMPTAFSVSEHIYYTVGNEQWSVPRLPNRLHHPVAALKLTF